jgi:hypothetical protein
MPTLPNPFVMDQNDDSELPEVDERLVDDGSELPEVDESRFVLDVERFMLDIEQPAAEAILPPASAMDSQWLYDLWDAADDLPDERPLFLGRG